MTSETAPHSEGTAQHPRFALESTLAHPVRFSLAAALAAVESAPFGQLRDELQVSDSVLSKQVAELERAGLVKASKGFVGKRPRTTLSLTAEGLTRWQRHLEALRRIAEPAQR
ncbi:transcriptional regulator [Brevibacterium album]|uniref:transcriptional regulator n=1 Tax=Brevibacterium album TaxID=417948 RepID=UPI00040D5C63|nr:transcriptional regulator [Brevibacterium album]